jgi:hypothetical protein
MGVSPGCYEVICTEIEAFKDRLVSIVNNDQASDRVYQLNLQLFPVSRQLPTEIPEIEGGRQ